VLSAADGNEALALAGTHPGNLDLLLTDVMLPGKNGVELATELRRSRPGLRLLFVSGYSADVLDSTPLENVHFLPKPFGPEDLTRAVRAALDGARTGT
jgi:DNA-binding response OmpR family regulator